MINYKKIDESSGPNICEDINHNEKYLILIYKKKISFTENFENFCFFLF